MFSYMVPIYSIQCQSTHPGSSMPIYVIWNRNIANNEFEIKSLYNKLIPFQSYLSLKENLELILSNELILIATFHTCVDVIN